MRKKTIVLMCGLMTICVSVSSQEVNSTRIDELEKRTEALEADATKAKKLQISGYIQGQWQWGQEAASMKVGSGNENPDKSFNRFGIRRGRIKFAYEQSIASGVFQLDITEKGVKFKDAYLNIKDPWAGSMALRAGIFDRPFGNEISYSSSRRESPERSTVFQTLFPDERDLGVMLILQAPKTSPWSILKLEAGLFAGNGIQLDTDSKKKDFIGHLSASKTIGSSISFGIGASYYNGKVYQGTQNIYTVKDNSFILDNNEANKGKFAKREYIGFDAQFSASSALGLTQLRGEYLLGQQPGSDKSTKSPNDKALPATDTYIRDFSGWYVIFIQDIGRSPFSVVVKYDSYDPNTKVSKNEVDSGKGFSAADLSQHTFGFGALWRISGALRLQAFYEINKNEKSINIAGMEKDLKSNLFTLRMQYKF